jgi:hypothetical protein
MGNSVDGLPEKKRIATVKTCFGTLILFSSLRGRHSAQEGMGLRTC